MVELFEKGYGKDAASIAHDAISQAKDSRTDVVLVDTAGRMQDNEPLMKALAKVNFFCGTLQMICTCVYARALTGRIW